ncbi:conserved unknown protein [Ectocarpus siliculosus]|uniref:Sulfotransferase n=1 Tax=Ectocarpus siliculosus TaxID=2880 RepID=D7G7C8_ECTSI|nr:conserved unknown protein [Ectocarpus siliculosus]|eukprot:CBJ27679.1 conserved unknown protein [Ectocarpus siliculosus]
MRPIGGKLPNVPVSETVDLEVPREGLLWQPTLMSPLKCGEAADLAADECEATITFCLMRMAEYQETPWKYPMAVMLQKKSGCSKAENLRSFHLSDLRTYMREHPEEFLQPNGFVYHETRTGSTLVANMLAHVPSNLVVSESNMAEDPVRRCSHCTEMQKVTLLREIMTLLGNGRNGHKHLFFKFQDSTTLPLMMKAYPEVGWVYLFRDPVEVMVSNLKCFANRPEKQQAMGSCVAELRRELEAALAGPAALQAASRGSVRRLATQARGDADERRQHPYLLVLLVFRRSLNFGLRRWCFCTCSRRNSHTHGSIAASPQRLGSLPRLQHGAYGKRERFYKGFDFDAADHDMNNNNNNNNININVTANHDPDKPEGKSGRPPMSPCLMSKPPSDMKGKPKEEICADRLRTLCQAAVDQLEEGGNGAVVEYTNLPDVVTEYIYPVLFGMGDDKLKDHLPYLSAAAGMYSKSMSNPESEFKQGTDAGYKHVMAEKAYQDAAEVTGLSAVYRKLQGLQTWHKGGERR